MLGFRTLNAMNEFRIIETLRPGMTLDEVIAYCKKYPEKVNRTEIGRKVLDCIKRGDTKRLRRYWMGTR